jgi:proline iminopeptidase
LAGYFFTHQIGRHDVRARLGEIDVPTLVIVGESDWVCAPEASRTIAAGIPGAELVILPEAGHFLFGEQPEAFADAVRRFVGAKMVVGVGGL